MSETKAREDMKEELLNVYDEMGRPQSVLTRSEAKASGLALGAVNVLLINANEQVLLQRRRADKENGGCWDKTVGGHVSGSEEFDDAALRETREELFDDPSSSRVLLAGQSEDWGGILATVDLREIVVLRRVAFQRNLRDIRRMPGGGFRNALYHVAVYAGLTKRNVEGFRPQSSEVEALAYFDLAEVDEMLLDGRLAPNMAFLWLTQAQSLLGLARR